jgi:hypothetical protein
VANDGCDGGSCCGVQGEAGGAGGSPAPSSTAAPYSPSTAREQLQRQATGERQPPRRPSGGGREGAVLGEGVRCAGGGPGAGRGYCEADWIAKLKVASGGDEMAREIARKGYCEAVGPVIF